MTTGAWIMMLCTWAVIAGNTGYCFYRLVTSKRDLSSDE